MATQGRSLYIIDDLTVLQQLDDEVVSSDVHLFKPRDSYRTQGRGGRASVTEGTNIPNGVITHFFLKDFEAEKDSVSLTYLEKDGDTIKTFSTYSKDNKLKDIKAGGNTFVWDTRYEGAERFDGEISGAF